MIDWAKVKKYAQLVQIAGQVVTGDYNDALKAAIQDLGYSFLESIPGSDFHGVSATFGFIALSSDKECVCALRGTAVKDFLEWLDDIEAIPVPSPFGHGLVHLGFKDVYGSLQLEDGTHVSRYIESLFVADKAIRAVITGHSLGGALATMVAAAVKALRPNDNVGSYTFASPRVGDHEFMNWYDQSLASSTYRVENCFDAVPNLPTNPPFEHVNTKFRVVGDIFEPIWKQHELTTYLGLIEKHLQ